MFGNRRLAKRSILGTRVSAPRQDGRFYPGVIQSQKSEGISTDSDNLFTVYFDDGTNREYGAESIIGPGFQQISQLLLREGQKVYLTLNGREISGRVISHNDEMDEVSVAVKLTTGEEVSVPRKIDEVRLSESRKSARLLDQDTDYSKLADLHMEPKRRAVSHVIDVPSKVSRQRHSTSSSAGDSSNHDDTEMMDERIAAMVLTSLSVSPVSPVFPQSPIDSLKGETKPFSRGPFQDGQYQYSSSFNSSGFLSSSACRSDMSDPSPPPSTHLSGSAPSPSYMSRAFSQHDEGIDLEENVRQYLDDIPEAKVNNNNVTPLVPKRMMFKCTWPGCGKTHSTCPAVEKHVRTSHLGMKDEDSDLSDHEEEFYYTEIEMTVENVTQTFSDMSTSSPPPHIIATTPTQPQEMMPMVPSRISDHDYQRKQVQLTQIPQSSSVPVVNGFFGQTMSNPIPISMSQVKRSLSWQNTTVSPGMGSSPSFRPPKPSPQERLFQHQAQSPKTHGLSSSPKSLGQYKKPRSDVRKCRKVYGMENRDMWCTQCKWKKACSRFMD